MENAEKLSITLPPGMARMIREKVRSGAYSSTSEVIREAVRNWERHEAEHRARLDAIRARIAESLADPRRDLSLDAAFARIERRHARTKTARKTGRA